MILQPNAVTKTQEGGIYAQLPATEEIDTYFLALHETSYWVILHSEKRSKWVDGVTSRTLRSQDHALYILYIPLKCLVQFQENNRYW